MADVFIDKADASTQIHGLMGSDWPAFLGRLSAVAQNYAAAMSFSASRGEMLALPGAEGHVEAVVVGLGDNRQEAAFMAGKLPTILPAGVYAFANWPADPVQSAVAFGLGAYQFRRYVKKNAKSVQLVVANANDRIEAARIVAAVAMGRDLVNTPASDLGPAALEKEAVTLARRYHADVEVICGDDLLAKNFPMIHAVGRASQQAPRLVDIRFGEPSHPKITLVGKGVCFDTGGLDIKPSAGMLLMKKDMGGAAAALASASMIMDANLPVRLRVLLPIVENAIAGNAFRPGDILQSRKGLTVEIGNTDAEGRLILADALTYAGEENPDLILDYATLTGAARVALGPQLPPFYTDSDTLADEIMAAAHAIVDPVWRMPLWQPYMNMIDSKVADINNSGGSPFAGSVTAALFLSRFISRPDAWAHFDIYGWNPGTRPAHPEGGEVQAARLTYDFLKRRYGGPR
ncbi:MAG: leucyl aminopeptidase family protein [Beijerinckiaceae bacterium]